MVDYEAIERLARLRDSGVLTEDEFASQKARILSGTVPVPSADNGHEIHSIPPQSTRSRFGLFVGLVIFVLLGLGVWIFIRHQGSVSAEDKLQTNSQILGEVASKNDLSTTSAAAEMDVTAQGGDEESTTQPDAPPAIIPSLPSFRDYSVPTTDSLAPLQLAGHEDYRTRLRAAFKSDPNFGANAVFVTWGCGTECSMGALVDRSTGLIIESPVGGEDQPLLDYKTEHGSNLLLASWTHKYDKDYNAIKPECVFEAFEFSGGQFKKLAGFPKKEAGSCPE